MRIGLDFDNTIVSYDRLFYQVAVERGLVPPDTVATKLGVRDYLRHQDREDEWTELQGIVYGSRMIDAVPFPGAINSIKSLLEDGEEVFIISHRTRYPYIGEQVDLHEAAKGWIGKRLVGEAGVLIASDNIYFNEEKEQKIGRISELNCDMFLDDLPEILDHESFPTTTQKILFDPERKHSEGDRYFVINRWSDLPDFVRKQKMKAVSA